jgi:hypothetical protein
MGKRLSREEVVTIQVLAGKGQNNSEKIARPWGVTEGAVRYQRGRLAEGVEDGRKNKPFKAEAVAEVIRRWHEVREEAGAKRPVNVQELYEHPGADPPVASLLQLLETFIASAARRHPQMRQPHLGPSPQSVCISRPGVCGLDLLRSSVSRLTVS